MKNYIYKTKVYYEDTDIGGVVYYANYLKFIERARTEMVYDQLNLKHNELKKMFDVMFVVKSCSIKYLKSAKFEDELTVITEILKKSRVRLVLQQEVKKITSRWLKLRLNLQLLIAKVMFRNYPKNY